jgi:hypothetical protein
MKAASEFPVTGQQNRDELLCFVALRRLFA